MDTVGAIQSIINTLEGLDIKSTYDNMDKLLGCLQLLVKIRDELKKTVEVKDGNDHAK